MLAVPAPSLMMLIALSIVTGPKPPGSTTLIGPPAAVLASAPLKVRHGAGRVQPWASLPPAETKLRMISPSGACARPGPAPAASTSRVAAANGNSATLDMNALPLTIVGLMTTVQSVSHSARPSKPAASLKVDSAEAMATLEAMSSHHNFRPGQQNKLVSEPPIAAPDEHAQLVEADQRFRAALGQAIAAGGERIEAVEATVQLKRRTKLPQ